MICEAMHYSPLTKGDRGLSGEAQRQLEKRAVIWGYCAEITHPEVCRHNPQAALAPFVRGNVSPTLFQGSSNSKDRKAGAPFRQLSTKGSIFGRKTVVEFEAIFPLRKGVRGLS